ncbi:hypothetical protein C8Q79DRAFT_1013922 [Trametes meyenii]|nr:hypothetical protein C8Q79DRAFT_1013922 [Trametes meyenii]
MPLAMNSLPLPPEIFLAFRASIPLSDICTHVSFYKAHPRIAAMYDAEVHADRFWRRVCWRCGIGALDGDDLDDPHCWRDIAMEVVEQDSACEHPQCARIERANERFGVVLGEEIEYWDVSNDLQLRAEDEYTAPRPLSVVMHHALSQIAFSPFGRCCSPSEDARLRAATLMEGNFDGEVLLCNHPLVWRSFATDVPVCALRLGRFGPHAMVENHARLVRPTGVTVYDVVEGMRRDLDVHLTSEETLIFLMTTFDSLPEGWVERAMGEKGDFTLRRLLMMCHIAEYVFEEDIPGEGPRFSVRLRSNAA